MVSYTEKWKSSGLWPLLFGFSALLSWHCRVSKSGTGGEDLQQLVNWMSGDFSSAVQHNRDTDFLDIRLHIHPIWTADRNNHWLYVEQATAAAENKPYRQRIYKVQRDNATGFKSEVYTLPDPAKWIGGYKTPALFEALNPGDLILREGCAVYLQKQKDSFSGATKGENCESTIRGAAYASSRVTVTEKMLTSWDQGFNARGEQVWGARKGGYEFVKN